MNLDQICNELVARGKERNYFIAVQQKLDRTIDSYIASQWFGYKGKDTPDTERKRVWKLVLKARKHIEAGKDLPAEAKDKIPLGAVMLIRENKKARAIFDGNKETKDGRIGCECAMIELAKLLPAPVVEFVGGVKGVGLLGLAVIVAEAGNLSRYSNRGQLEHALSVACTPDGERQRKKSGVTQEEAKAVGYRPRRRAQIWAFLDDVMMRKQWVGDKDEDGNNPKKSHMPVAYPAHAVGPYGEKYGAKKAEYLARGWTASHAEKAARRYAGKIFLRQLWRVWVRVEQSEIRLAA